MNKLDNYFNALSRLKVAQEDVKLINLVVSAIENYERYYSINILSNILVTYKFEIDKISKLIGNDEITVEKKEPIERYNDEEISDEQVLHDLHYVHDCLILISVLALEPFPIKPINISLFDTPFPG